MKEYPIQENIANLTSLWEKAALSVDGFKSESAFDYALVEGSEWPNRLWFKKTVNQELLDLAIVRLKSLSVNLTVPYWGSENGEETMLERNGFNFLFRQVGMSIKLEKRFSEVGNIRLVRVINMTQAIVWGAIFKRSFGYTISSELVLKSKDVIHYYLAFDGEEPIGTFILMQTGSVVGAHALGIPPENRRKGYARRIMKQAINLSIKAGNEFMTLQASDMGLPLYLELGFKEDFIIRNYRL